MEQLDKGMCDGRLVPSRIELVCEGIKGEWIFSEVGDVEHGFGIW